MSSHVFRRLLLALLVLLLLVAGVLYFSAGRILGSDLVRSALEQQLSTYLGHPVRIGRISAVVFPRVAIDLGDVAVGEPVALRLGRVRISTGLRPLLSRTVEDAEVLLAQGEVRLPLALDLFPAAPPSAVPAEPAMIVRSVRAIELRQITLVVGAQSWSTDADCTVQGDQLTVSRLAARSGVTRLEGAGQLSSMSRSEGRFTVAANPLDLDELIAFGSALSRPTPGPRTATSSFGPISVALTSPAGRIATYDFRDLETSATLRDSAISLAPLRVSALGGRFDGRLDVDTRNPVPALKLTGRVDGLNVVEVLKMAGGGGGLTGTLGGSVSLSASGTDSAALLRTARGTVAAAITNGTMPGLDLVRPIILAFGKPSGAPPAGSGSTFSRLGGTFALAGGTVSSDDISMSSRDFDTRGSVTVTLAGGALAARGDVVLSNELTAQSGTDLRRYAQEDGRVVVPARIGGTLQQPTVALDVASAMRRALGNELQRRTKSLFDGLFRRKKQ